MGRGPSARGPTGRVANRPEVPHRCLKKVSTPARGYDDRVVLWDYPLALMAGHAGSMYGSEALAVGRGHYGSWPAGVGPWGRL